MFFNINLYREKKDPEVFEAGRERKFIKLYDWIKIVQENGVGEIYIFSIDNDGIDHEIDIQILKSERNIESANHIWMWNK